MPANILPEDADRSNVYVSVFNYDSPQDKYVLPLTDTTGTGLGGFVTGEVTLVSGVATVPLTSIAADSTVILSRRTVGGTTGTLGYTRSAGVGFSITNTSATETGIISYLVIP